MNLTNDLAELFRRDLTRLMQEVEGIPEAALWSTLPGVTNSAGNLALHLEGNLREYIGRQLGGTEYRRRRDLEFSAREIPAAELLARLTALRDSIPPLIAALSAEALDAAYPEVVLNRPLTTRQFLLHLHSHFNYHLGQIDYLRRILTAGSSLPLAGL